MPASVHKAALVLDLFSVERPDWGPTEVADELRIAKSTAHALLGELASVGLTERLPCGRYRLGWRTLRTRADETGHERVPRGNHADGTPAGEPLRRDGPHHGMGARPRAVCRK
jgi:IclR helix-turn-helix domain